MALLHSRSSFYSPPEVFKTATNTQGISASVSLPVALEKIFAYLEKQNHRPSSESLALKLEPCTFTSIEFTHLLESLNPDEFEFRYQPEIHIFELLPMPKFVHDAFSFFLGRLCHHRIPWLTPHEHDHLNVFKSSQTMKGSAPTTFVHSKRQAMDKEPDGAITFGDLEGPDDVLWPVVVAEVGFSQQYNSLLQDARQWLLRAEMPPTIVMLLKIQENLPGLRMRKLTPDYSVRLQNLLRKYGDGFRLAKANMDGDGVSGVDFNYRHMQQEILVEDWVGEMEVFFEIWVREETNSEIRPRVQRYVSLFSFPFALL
jgi:hypothetical protein